MIVIPLDITGERHLADRKTIAGWTHRPEITVRRHCEPVGCHVATRALLYEAEKCYELLLAIPRRERPVQSTRRSAAMRLTAAA